MARWVDRAGASEPIADFQSANAVKAQARHGSRRFADWKSAIQPVGNRRYGAGPSGSPLPGSPLS